MSHCELRMWKNLQKIHMKYTIRMSYFQNCILFSETFKRQLKRNASRLTRTNLRYILHQLIVMVACAGPCTLPPLLLGIMVLNPAQPLHRFVHYVTGYSPKLELASLPLVLFSAIVGTKGGPLGTMYLNTGLMYMQFETFWMSVLRPERRNKFGNVHTFINYLR